MNSHLASSLSKLAGCVALAATFAAPVAAQINYSFNFDANSTGWGGNFTRYTGATACGGTGGAMRRNLYSGATTGQLISPLTGVSQGGAVDIFFDYKVAVWSANTVGAASPFGSIEVQYGATAAGPWTTIGSFTDEAQTGTCISKNFNFIPGAGDLYIRFNCQWTGGDNYWNFDNIVMTETVSACSGTPAPGDTIAPVIGVCPGANFSLSLQNATVGSGVSYQWYASSASNSGPWSPIGGNTATLQTSQSSTGWYYCDVTCSGNTGSSNVVEVGMNTGANPETFENGLTANCWSATGGTQTTLLGTVSGYGVGTSSAKFDFWSWSAGQTAQLTSPEFTAVGAGEQLYFDVAGTMWSGSTTSIDFVTLEESNDAGSTWTPIVTMDNSPTGVLRTAAPGGLFTPSSAQWASLAYPLSAGTNRVRFVALAGFGNNIYLDNVSVGVLPSARHSNYGAGCGMSMTASPAPISGTSFNYNLPSVPLACPAPDPEVYFGFVIVSFSQNFAGTSLQSIGFDSPGCNLYVNSLDVLLSYADVVASQTVALSLPAGAPAGAVLYSQAVALQCPAAPNNAGLVLSNGVRSYINSF